MSSLPGSLTWWYDALSSTKENRDRQETAQKREELCMRLEEGLYSWAENCPLLSNSKPTLTLRTMHPIHPHPWIPPDSTGAQDSSPQQHGDTGEERPGRPGCAASLAITAVDPHQDAGWGVTWLGTFAWPQPPKRVVSRVGVLIIYSILKIQCWLSTICLRRALMKLMPKSLEDVEM